MPKLPARLTRTWLDHLPFHGYITGLDFSVDQELPDVTCLSDTGPRRVAGNYSHKHSLTGLFDASTSTSETASDPAAFVNLLSTGDHYVFHTFAGGVAGDVGYDSLAQLASQPRAAASAGAVTLNVELEGAGSLSRARIVRNAAFTTTSTSPGVNAGVTTTSQLFAVTYRLLSVTPSSSTGTLVLVTQESSDDAAGDPYGDIAGSSATFTAVGVQRITSTAATEAWKRLRVQSFTTWTSMSVLMTVGRIAV